MRVAASSVRGVGILVAAPLGWVGCLADVGGGGVGRGWEVLGVARQPLTSRDRRGKRAREQNRQTTNYFSV